MFCVKCGARIADGAAFCQNCGTAATNSGETNIPYVNAPNSGNGSAMPMHSTGIGPDFNAATSTGGSSMNVIDDSGYNNGSGFYGNSYQNPNYRQNNGYQNTPNVGDINSAKYSKPDVTRTGDVVGSVLLPIGGIILGIYYINTGRPKAGKTYLYTALIAWMVFSVLFALLK